MRDLLEDGGQIFVDGAGFDGAVAAAAWGAEGGQERGRGEQCAFQKSAAGWLRRHWVRPLHAILVRNQFSG